jgi:hypothetical protein
MAIQIVPVLPAPAEALPQPRAHKRLHQLSKQTHSKGHFEQAAKGRLLAAMWLEACDLLQVQSQGCSLGKKKTQIIKVLILKVLKYCRGLLCVQPTSCCGLG